MELIVIALMLGLVFKTAIVNATKANFPIVKSNLEPLIKYLGASAVLTATIAALPSLYMVIYMRTEGFFAYELFTQESHGFGVLASNIFINYVMLSFGLFGAAVLFGLKVEKLMLGLVAFINALMITYFTLLSYATGNWVIFGGMVGFTFAIAGYLKFWLSSGIEGKAKAWYAPLILAAVLVAFPVFLQEPAAKFTGSALSQMKVGGMMVEISESKQIFAPEAQYKPAKQWLVLRTPDSLYLKAAPTNKTVTVLKAEGIAVSPVKVQE